MRAMAFAKPGGPEVLELMDLPVPEFGDDEVLVQVKATDNLPTLQDGRTIAFPIAREDLRSWLREPDPVIIIVYDGSKDKAYWLYVQAYFESVRPLDLFTAPELKSALSEAIESGHTRIVVDLTDTTFLDSTALGVLIGAVKRLRSRDGRLTIVNVDDNIAKTFEITGLDQIFPISPTRAEAVKALDAEEAASS